MGGPARRLVPSRVVATGSSAPHGRRLRPGASQRPQVHLRLDFLVVVPHRRLDAVSVVAFPSRGSRPGKFLLRFYGLFFGS